MRVKIKTWAAMAKEFGVDSNSINCNYGFTKSMELMMPKERYIEIEINPYGVYKWKGWSISEDMIEKVNPYLEAMERL